LIPKTIAQLSDSATSRIMAQSPTARFRGKIHGLSDGNRKIGRRTDANCRQAANLNRFVHVNDRKVVL
jgi:hypothetical protein